jgi:hypothetical protein
MRILELLQSYRTIAELAIHTVLFDKIALHTRFAAACQARFIPAG